MPSSVSSSPAVKIKGGGVAATTPSSTINPPPIGGGRHYFSTLLRQMDQEKVLSKIEEGTANGKTTNNIVGDDGEKVKTQTSPKRNYTQN
uniref:Uncharacterized protein n=1 Tax=Meloidogyne enterolobii TaxID=390850 RepID=A0A6V7TLI3_MELEN|nr:unnamed protein product [Meloidogyne enterolobii]